MSTPTHQLDLRGVACPMNFVKTRLFMDKMPTGAVLRVELDDGEPVESVCESIAAEGHRVLSREQQGGGHFSVLIEKT